MEEVAYIVIALFFLIIIYNVYLGYVGNTSKLKLLNGLMDYKMQKLSEHVDLLEKIVRTRETSSINTLEDLVRMERTYEEALHEINIELLEVATVLMKDEDEEVSKKAIELIKCGKI